MTARTDDSTVMAPIVHNAEGEFEATPEQAALDAQAARYRSLRMSYREIADQMGISVSSAHTRVKRALAAVPVESVTELRRVELDALGWQQQQLILIARDQKSSKSERVAALRELRLSSESMRRLLGLDAPTQHHITVDDNTLTQIDRLAAELDAMAAEVRESAQV